MAMWQKDGVFLHPLFEFKCLGCRTPKADFTEVGFVLNKFPLYNDKPEEYDSHALDRTFVCDLCGYRIVFGLAVSNKHHDEIDEWMQAGEKRDMELRKQRVLIQGKLDEAKERVFKTTG